MRNGREDATHPVLARYIVAEESGGWTIALGEVRYGFYSTVKVAVRTATEAAFEAVMAGNDAEIVVHCGDGSVRQELICANDLSLPAPSDVLARLTSDT